MAQKNDIEARPRVRTPGKHIVMFAASALVIFAAGANLMRAGQHQQALADAGVRLAGDRAAISLDEFLVDLAPDASGRTAYLKLHAHVVPPAQGAARAAHRINDARPELAERLTFLLRGLSRDDFDGEDGMARVKAEMLLRVNLVIAPEKARDVVITDLVIQ